MIIISMLSYMLMASGVLKSFFLKITPFVIFLLLACFYSISEKINVSGLAFGEARDILLSAIVAVFLICCCESSERNRIIIYRSIKRVFVTIAIAKVLVIFYSMISGISMKDIILWIRDVWNIQMMSLGVEGTIFFRLQIPLDSAVPFFMYFMTKEIIFSTRGKLLLYSECILLVISILLTLSRTFWAEAVLITFLAICFEGGITRFFKIIISLSVILLLMLYVTPIGDAVYKIVESRFGDNSAANMSSDIERIWQNRMLYNEFINSPILGHGLGYFIPNAIRSETVPYLYESQSLSMLMVLGVFGSAVLLLLYVYLCMSTVYKDNGGGIKIIVPIIFLMLWVFSGSVNPLLFGASGGVILFFISKFASLYKVGDS